MSAPLVATLREERSRDRVVRTVRLPDREIWWEITGGSLPPKLSRHDQAAVALVFHAMRQRRSLRIDGPVSAHLLEQLENFIGCWTSWRPDLYRKIDVTATEEVRDEAAGSGAARKAVMAFSGGLDSTYTAWTHANGQAGRRSRTPIVGVLIHGFDIPLDNAVAFARASQSAAETLASIDIPYAVVRTNWKDVETDWTMEFGAAVAACLYNWHGAADTGLIASDEDYTRLVTPWGSNPITNSMLSARDFAVTYDGGEVPRTGKAAAIAGWQIGLANLRVCWQGEITGRNCGMCEKCIRTKLNFMAVGAPLPESLRPAPSALEVFGVRASNDVQLKLLAEILATAHSHGITAPWLRSLRATIAKNRLMNAAREVGPLRATYSFAKRGARALRARGAV